MNSTTEIPTVEQTVAAIKREILADIADGSMPADVASFSALHDYTDANMYGGMGDALPEALHAASGLGDDAEWSDELRETWITHCNEATNIVDAWLRAGRPEPTDAQAAPPVGSVVVFREGTGPHEQNAGRRFVVTESPNGAAWSVDNTHGEPRQYVWLVDARDLDKAPSRRRTRSGYVSDLTSA